MEKLLKLIEAKIIPITEKVGKQRHLQAIRDGVIQALPLILIGSFFLLLAQPPGEYLTKLVEPYAPLILVPFRFTFGLIALYVSFSVAYSLTKRYDMESDALSHGVISAVVFLLCATPRVAVEGFSYPLLPKGDTGIFLPIKYLGSEGLFLGIIIGLLTVELLRFLKGRKLMFSMPKGVPEVISKSFEAILPSGITVSLFWVIRDILKVDLPTLVVKIFEPVVKVGDSIFAVIVLNLVDSMFWFAGIHPVAVTGPVLRPIWLKLLTENADAVEAMGKGSILPHIAVDQFYFWFVWVGGAGASIGLVLLLLTAKSKMLRQLGKICLIPGVFNINEPLIFGLPIVANPLMIIPFCLAPLAGGIVSYIAFSMNLVSRPYISAPWTLPAPIGAYVSTGGDIRALLLSVFVIIMSSAIYYPFFRLYDKKMLEKEEEEEGKNGNDKKPGEEQNSKETATTAVPQKSSS